MTTKVVPAPPLPVSY